MLSQKRRGGTIMAWFIDRLAQLVDDGLDWTDTHNTPGLPRWGTSTQSNSTSGSGGDKSRANEIGHQFMKSKLLGSANQSPSTSGSGGDRSRANDTGHLFMKSKLLGSANQSPSHKNVDLGRVSNNTLLDGDVVFRSGAASSAPNAFSSGAASSERDAFASYEEDDRGFEVRQNIPMASSSSGKASSAHADDTFGSYSLNDFIRGKRRGDDSDLRGASKTKRQHINAFDDQGQHVNAFDDQGQHVNASDDQGQHVYASDDQGQHGNTDPRLPKFTKMVGNKLYGHIGDEKWKPVNPSGLLRLGWGQGPRRGGCGNRRGL